MTIRKVDLFDSTYGNFEADVLVRIRQKTFGEDFGQNSWTTADEYRGWARWLALGEGSHALEVASGSGGPALFLASLGAGQVTGVDLNTHGIAAARAAAKARGMEDRVRFEQVDADQALPFADGTFDAIVCVDSANHFLDRARALRDWKRVLKPGGRVIFTDPVVIRGLVTAEELAVRSSVGPFLFAPEGVNERLIADAGLRLVRTEDGSANATAVAGRWHDARAEEVTALVPLEGDERYAGLQAFFAMVQRVTGEGRLARVIYFAERPAGD